MRFGVFEIILVVIIVLLITGAAFVPAVGRNLGKGVRQLRQALGGSESDDSPKVITKLEDGEAAQEINRRAKGKNSPSSS